MLASGLSSRTGGVTSSKKFTGGRGRAPVDLQYRGSQPYQKLNLRGMPWPARSLCGGLKNRVGVGGGGWKSLA